jgi:hypothetical protein
MIANRKLCRHMVANAPGTIIEILRRAAKAEKPVLPLGQFARNVTEEAISNKDSGLYHEDEGYESGYFGYVKPLSEALFGNYAFIAALGARFGSPLDLSYRRFGTWDSEQLSVYARGVLMALEDYLAKHKHGVWQASPLNRAFEIVKSTCGRIFMLDTDTVDAASSDLVKKFEIAIECASDAIKLIDDQKDINLGSLRSREPRSRILDPNLCEHIAELMFQLLTAISSVKGKGFVVWHLMHNTAWEYTFGHGGQGRARNAVRFKLRRMLYEEIKRLEKLPNYQSAKVLGLCLYVMGLEISRKTTIDQDYVALRKVVLRWTRKNYLRLVSMQPDVAAACLVGSLSFDQANGRLSKTYEKGLNLEAPIEYLDLEPASMAPDSAPLKAEPPLRAIATAAHSLPREGGPAHGQQLR